MTDKQDESPEKPTPAHARQVVHEDRREVVAREREEHGGVKVGAAFFGWLTATGMAVLLTALATAAGTAVGVATGNESAGEAVDAVGAEVETIGLVGGIVLLLILFVAYYSGGYVAGRMSRFDGIKQGIAVWVWAIVVAVVVAALVWIAGDEYNVLGDVDSFPRIPVGEGDLTTGGLIALVLVLVVSLVGAMLGGLAGMRFHRQVDKAGLGA
ncbi:hypothetical protein [Nocardioides coralli]|uniref:hypothetical protein n=1 Tax=Nocardioides coralli TaxID=2872154 RepID=UPI001CA3CD8D|nr:hypothetical protein [Nocardioides coralli]QZY29058.1 hypothetical protein K6T13_16765 [Nocardioides coralli]